MKLDKHKPSRDSNQGSGQSLTEFPDQNHDDQGWLTSLIMKDS